MLRSFAARTQSSGGGAAPSALAVSAQHETMVGNDSWM
jgi:hypothetical protein